ncbi:hypothetical protein [Stutzerimonas zhaodongensis]|uniref:hypothetical protein n=1 Tax=Stutzerimonas zhaodongensis TaxID=1176257 RepID=UPI0011C426BE|nr:hypothetical protein [Stutzerimonas zhaodongensis]MCQ4316277.1 hypothetical protein [Stutzerimonas zhaodongensis]
MLNDILEKSYPRRAFFITVAALLGILVLIRYIILPELEPTVKTGLVIFLANISDGIIVSMLVTIFIGVFLFFLTPEAVKKSRIEITEPRNLPELFEKAFPVAELWWYKGGCGRYFRTKTLPAMACWARRTSLSREVRVVILDPLNTALCEAHATYRRSTASAGLDEHTWDLNKVRHELYATIVTVLITQSNEPRLRINLSLASHYSAFRIDLSSTSAIITKEDRKAPAIICHPENYYYKSYKEEIILSESQSRHVPPLAHGSYDLNYLDKSSVEKILSDSKLIYQGMSEEDFDKIAITCREKLNPYE